MDLLALRYFQAVARLEHVGRAADQLRVAQPSLSRTLARLESDLGVPLFDRRGRRIRLNRFGAAFLRRVDRVLAELDDARQELVDAVGLSGGTVTLAAETLIPLVEPLRSFVADHPLVDVRLVQSSAAMMAQQLRAGDVDLCVASQPLPGQGIESQVLLDEPVLLCVPVGHRLAGRSRVGVAELAGEPFLTTRPGFWQRALVERLFATAGVELSVVCEGDEPSVLFELIGAGLGIGLVPSVGRLTSAATPVSWVEVDDPDCRRVLSVAWREDGYLSVAALRFRDHVARHFE
ncbi:LysR substrate-binding domain-containing protein [Kibdelosporangium philippinense]|uniref:LysR substrate-binding domain-containing protein n=1 Tax=Kibdelosporangium philippinense TaxID=211113 RepID=A0ABS8ZY46_9PSEU|nr:LysR substrate-binding domain-containing protein [Kibdelosporangium philippinense]MCE7010962.1 LysR substrate-binding domain-containing protein [Kibdelosporangium philippinense]